MQEVESSTAQKLDPSERARLAWALTWPCVTAGLLYELARKVFGAPEDGMLGLDAAFSILFFFAFSTWVVRRAVGMSFPGFHLAVVRQSSEKPSSPMTYRESITVTWLLVWRSSLVVIGLTVVVDGVLMLLGRAPLTQRLIVALWTSAAEILLFYLWLVDAMLKKQYSGFSLALLR